MEQPSETKHAQNPQMGNFLAEVEHFLKTYLYDKAPFHFPPHVREWIVKYGPWIDLILLVLALPVIFAAFSISLFALPFAAAFSPFGSVMGILHWAIILATFVLEIIALPGLFHRSLRSWYLIYYASLLSGVIQLITGNIVGALVGTAITVYVLFQIKSYYK